MDLRKYLRENHPQLKAKYDSEQYVYSEKLIEIKLKYKLTQLEMSELADIDYNRYLSMEGCDISIPTIEYVDVVNNINNSLEEL